MIVKDLSKNFNPYPKSGRKIEEKKTIKNTKKANKKKRKYKEKKHKKRAKNRLLYYAKKHKIQYCTN